MSELDPRSRVSIPDWQSDFLPITTSYDDLIDTNTNQLTSDFSPKFTQQSPGENYSFAAIESRDITISPTPIVSYPYGEWGCSGFPAAENGLLDIGGTGSSNFRTINTPITPPEDFRSRATQEPLFVEDWSSILDPRFPLGMNVNTIGPVDNFRVQFSGMSANWLLGRLARFGQTTLTTGSGTFPSNL